MAGESSARACYIFRSPEDLQAHRFHLEGRPDDGVTIGKLLEDGSALRLELDNFDFTVVRQQSLTTEWSPHPLSRNSQTQTPELDESFWRISVPSEQLHTPLRYSGRCCLSPDKKAETPHIASYNRCLLLQWPVSPRSA